jgi:hypothetical protein
MNIKEYQLSGRASRAACVESEQRRLRQAMTWEQRITVREVEQIRCEWGEPEVDAPAAAEPEG